MRKLVLILAFSLSVEARADSSNFDADKYTSELVERVTSSISKHETCSCSVTPPTFCQVIAGYPRDSGVNNIDAFGGTASGFCTKNLPQKRDLCQPELASQSELSPVYAPVSREEMEAHGFRVLQGGERREYLLRVERVRDRFAESCCGKNSECKDAFKRIRVAICTPNAKDSCTRAGGYTNSNLEGELIHDRFMEREKVFMKDDSLSRYQSKFKKRLGELYDDTKESGALVIPEFPYAGAVTLNPYVTGSTESLSDDPIVHEFIHACSSIKRQQAMMLAKDRDIVVSEAISLYPITLEYRCDSEKNKPAYDLLYAQFYDGDIPSFTQCISSLGDVAHFGSATRAACPQACSTAYMEEGFVMLQYLKDSKFKNIEENVCVGFRDGLHPLRQDAVECALQHSPKFRSEIAAGAGCSK